MKSMGELLGTPLVSGTLVTHLENGDQIVSSMIEAVKSAEMTITFEDFIYWEVKIDKNFSNLLSEKDKNEVKVHVILD